MAALFFALGLSYLHGIHAFLAITDRQPAHLLAVEGWVNPQVIRAASAEFTDGGYTDIIATGGLVPGLRLFEDRPLNAAWIGAERLKLAGVPEARVHMAPAGPSQRDRTYHSALALREWLRAHHPDTRSINIVTHDVHARRTRLLFQRALGPTITVGIIAIGSETYDARHWWRYSEGVREVLGETIAYVYARFLFTPSDSPAGGTPPNRR